MCGKFPVLPSVIKRRKFTLLKSYQHITMEVKCAAIKNQDQTQRKQINKETDTAATMVYSLKKRDRT